jgi:hypothetical protein
MLELTVASSCERDKAHSLPTSHKLTEVDRDGGRRVVHCMGVPNLTGALIGTAGTAPITAAIPGPSTYALMLGGLGLAAWVARRRKTVASAV